MTVDLNEFSTSLRRSRVSLEATLAVLIFAVFSVFVLTTTHRYLEPDDYSYRAAVAALASGHVRLDVAQYKALARSLASSGVLPNNGLHGVGGALGLGQTGLGSFPPPTAQGIAGRLAKGVGASGQLIPQWHEMASGYYMTEKNYGYVLLATPFYLIGALNFEPIFYGGLACFSLFVGARRWIGSRGGLFAVVLYIFSGLAITFAWRSTMETFTDASLIATGVGLLLLVFLASEKSQRFRAIVGGFGFLALSMATFTRYTDLVALVVALLAVIIFARRSQISRTTLAIWFFVSALLMAAIALFNFWAYGSFISTGYSSGVIQFSVSSIWPNMTSVLPQVIVALPASIFALSAIGYALLRYLRKGGKATDGESHSCRQDLVIVASLAGAWFGFWLVYLAYSWTVNQSGAGLHVVRFYVPAISFVALLGAFLISKLPKTIAIGFAVAVVVLAFVSFYHLTGGSSNALGGGAHGPLGLGANGVFGPGQNGQFLGNPFTGGTAAGGVG